MLSSPVEMISNQWHTYSYTSSKVPSHGKLQSIRPMFTWKSSLWALLFFAIDFQLHLKNASNMPILLDSLNALIINISMAYSQTSITTWWLWVPGFGHNPPICYTITTSCRFWLYTDGNFTHSEMLNLRCPEAKILLNIHLLQWIINFHRAQDFHRA